MNITLPISNTHNKQFIIFTAPFMSGLSYTQLKVFFIMIITDLGGEGLLGFPDL